MGRTTERRERDKRLPEVLNAAVKVFWEKDYSAATIQVIADEPCSSGNGGS